MHETGTHCVPGWLAEILAGIDGEWITAANPENATRRTGAYVLALRLGTHADIDLRGAALRFPPGWYAYCGSARGGGGIGARAARHLRRENPIHWHVDRLTTRAEAMAVLAVPRGNECALVARLLATGRFETPVAGFGSSDCRRCAAHLLAARQIQAPISS